MDRRVVGVYLDHNLGGMAKDILLLDSIDQIEQTSPQVRPTSSSQSS